MVSQSYADERSDPILSRLLARLGWLPIVTIRGRRTGQPHRTSLAPVTLNGSRYLVAVRGATDWAANLAAATQGELRSRGRRESFGAVEVTGPEREAVLALYERRIGRLMAITRIPGWPTESRVFRIWPSADADRAQPNGKET